MRRPSLDQSDPSRNLEESRGPFDSAEPAPDDMELDFSLSADEDDSRIFSPPPRIAARFYRPSHNRRKDSAASSRRNSMSSIHSRSSHGFAHGNDPQSKYVAQQLRRASILEDRKARLADRAAHAEKVRLRAALAKATPARTSHAEERALAAAQAREKNLADIAAACAEEVKRAKAVAESQKEKREHELRKLKIHMDERLAEAEKRREELRRTHAAKRSRGSSLTTKKSESGASPGSEQAPQHLGPTPACVSDDVAASRLQWWWRSLLRRKAVADFTNLGLNVDGVRETSFETVVQLLAQESVLTTTARVLRECGVREGDTGSVGEMAAVRTFLSAFMILGHPTQVLSNKDNQPAEPLGSQGQHIPRDDLANPQQQELVGKARDLLICFENILSRFTSANNYTPPPALQGTLSESYAAFHNAFIAWKARDSDALIEVMIMQFVELDAILETVKAKTEEPVTDTYRDSVKDNQLMLMVRIKKLAGPQQGKKMIFDAVKQARKARAAKRPTGDTKPRAAEGSMSTGTSSSDQTAADHVVSHLQSLTPPPSPHARPDTQPPSAHIAYPPILPDNRMLVHELAINREYRIEFSYFQEQHKQRMDPFFQDLRMSDQDEERQFQYLIVMATYIKDRLQNLVKPGTSMHTFIGEMLDTDVAQRQFLAGGFSYEKFFNSMGSLLPKLCAPARDDEVKDLVENKLRTGDIVGRLEALITFIDVMLYDYANYMLQVAAPKLLEHATPYESKRFADDLDSGATQLIKAEGSWRAAHSKIHTEAARRDPEGVNHPRNRPTADKIYWQMLLDEFTRPSPSQESIPEPLALDAARRRRIGRQTMRVVAAGAILLQCKNMLKRDVRAPWRTEAGRILGILESRDDATRQLKQEAAVDGIMTVLESGRSMPAATKTHLRALAIKVLAADEEAKRTDADPREPVLGLLLKRLRTHMLARLQAASASDKVKMTSTASEKLANLGLPEFVDKIGEMVDEIVRVGAVDREAHGVWWEQVAARVDAPAAASSSTQPC